MAEFRTEREHTLKTYRYVRIAMVTLVVGIFAAVVIHNDTESGGFLGSISAYYYTPVRGMFAGSLLAIGLCLVCIRGGTTQEDVLLNIAGMLAPVVALVPTQPDPKLGDAYQRAVADREAAVANNWPALMWVALFAVLVLAVVVSVERVRGGTWPEQGVVKGFLGTMLVVVVAHAWYRENNGAFLEKAHYLAAITMFVCVAVAAIFDGVRAAKHTPKRGRTYVGIGVSMIVFGAAILGVGRLADWNQAVLAAEALLIALFAVFWAMQTADLWNYTSRTEAIEHRRAATESPQFADSTATGSS